MKLLWASFGFILVLLGFAPMARSQENLVRVRLKIAQSEVTVSGQALRFQAEDGKYQAVALPRNSQVQVRIIHKDSKPLWALRVNGKDFEHLFSQKYLLIRGENLRADSASLPSRLLLSMNEGKKMDLVGVIPLEDYVMGVVSSEMPMSWPLESLKAQAVAARSYVLAVMKERENRPFHVESSVLDQVFKHALFHESEDLHMKKVVQAVRDTEGQRLLSPQGRTLKSFYHADCGGKTALAKDVWSYAVNSGIAVDSSCPLSPRAQWSLRLSTREISQRLGRLISGIDLIRTSSEARVSKVQLLLQDGQKKLLSSNDFRRALGFQDLKSTLFEVKKDGNDFVFTGRGFGHGVGLCQWGTKALAQKGLKYQEILRHYYPLAKLGEVAVGSKVATAF